MDRRRRASHQALGTDTKRFGHLNLSGLKTKDATPMPMLGPSTATALQGDRDNLNPKSERKKNEMVLMPPDGDLFKPR